MPAGPDSTLVSLGTLLFLGAFHGINPGMGWLFAVALAMQENRRAVIWRSLVPLGIGHAAAIAVVVLLGIIAGTLVPTTVLRWPIAGALVALGIRHLLRHRHPCWGSMRIGMAGLTIWSFLVATAHGAGLMVLPVWLGMQSATAAHVHHAESLGMMHGGSVAGADQFAAGLLATAIHGTGYLLITALAAWVVFTTVGVGLLRKAWINLDLIWAIALIVSGCLSLKVL
jgi:hypothetical protein